MTTEEFTTTVITASEGYVLTQVEEVEITERITATTLALGRYDSVENYREITLEEAQAIRDEQQKIIEEQMKKDVEPIEK